MLQVLGGECGAFAEASWDSHTLSFADVHESFVSSAENTEVGGILGRILQMFHHRKR